MRGEKSDEKPGWYRGRDASLSGIDGRWRMQRDRADNTAAAPSEGSVSTAGRGLALPPPRGVRGPPSPRRAVERLLPSGPRGFRARARQPRLELAGTPGRAQLLGQHIWSFGTRLVCHFRGRHTAPPAELSAPRGTGTGRSGGRSARSRSIASSRQVSAGGILDTAATPTRSPVATALSALQSETLSGHSRTVWRKR